MLRTLLLFFVYFSLFQIHGQELLVTYSYTKNTNTNSEIKISQDTFLEIENNKSVFYSDGLYQADSIIRASKNGNLKVNFKTLPDDILGGFVKKNLISKEIVFHSNEFDRNEFYFSEKNPCKWDISSVEHEILGYRTYEAKMKYGGRSYTAYYAPDIAISDGPYKFFGLPGLILKIFDDKNQHDFTAIAITQQNFHHRFSQPDRKYVSTERPKYFEYRKNFRMAPLNDLIRMMNSTGIYEMKDKNGNVIDLRKSTAQKQKELTEYYSKINDIENL